MKKSKAMVWYPAAQTPVENGYYLVAVLYADSEAVETTVKTARFIEGRWVGFSDGLRDGEDMAYWLPIPQLPGCPPFTQLAD